MWKLYKKESWVLKNWWSWTVVFEKTLESSLDYKDINQSILKEISPDYSLEWLMLKLKLQYFGHLVWRTDSLEKTLILRKTEGRRRGDNRGWDGWMASPTWWTWVEKASEVGDGQGGLACCSPWGCKELDTTEQLKGTELNIFSAGEGNFKKWEKWQSFQQR